MDIKSISIVSGTALLALTMNASAGPMSITSSQIITPPIQIEQAHYYRHHYRHYGWHRGWHHWLISRLAPWLDPTMVIIMVTAIRMAMVSGPDWRLSRPRLWQPLPQSPSR